MQYFYFFTKIKNGCCLFRRSRIPSCDRWALALLTFTVVLADRFGCYNRPVHIFTLMHVLHKVANQFYGIYKQALMLSTPNNFSAA